MHYVKDQQWTVFLQAVVTILDGFEYTANILYIYTHKNIDDTDDHHHLRYGNDWFIIECIYVYIYVYFFFHEEAWPKSSIKGWSLRQRSHGRSFCPHSCGGMSEANRVRRGRAQLCLQRRAKPLLRLESQSDSYSESHSKSYSESFSDSYSESYLKSCS